MNGQQIGVIALVLILLVVYLLANHKSNVSNPISPQMPIPEVPGVHSAELPDVESQFNEAMRKIKEKNSTGAILLMRQMVERVEKSSGTNSPNHAKGLYKLAAIYATAGDLESAADALRQTCLCVPNDTQSQKDRLTYQMNLGSILVRTGQIAEAEKVLRTSLGERERFYGVKHAGYAYGLESLAELLLSQSKSAEARQLATNACDICLHSNTPLTPQAFALRAFAVFATNGNALEAWDQVEQLPLESRLAMYNNVLNRSDLFSGTFVLNTLESAQHRVETDSSASDLLKRNFGVAMVTTARREKDAVRWLAAVERMMPRAEIIGERQMIMDLLENKAMAYEAADNRTMAKSCYEAAVARALQFSDALHISRAHRNFGLFLKDVNEIAGAAMHLDAAVEFARKTDNKECLGSALAAQGIFVQHNGDLKRARVILFEAVSLMSPAHEHFLYAQNHLNAIMKNQSCGCGNMDETIAETIKGLVRSRLPADLVKEVNVTQKLLAMPDVKVELARGPSKAEKENVDLVIRQAIVELQAAIKAAANPR